MIGKSLRGPARNSLAIASAESSEGPPSLVRRLGNGAHPQPRRTSDDGDREGRDGQKDNVDEMDRGSDSEGNQWKMGYVYSDDYSDLDSEGASMQVSRESVRVTFSYRFKK